MSIIEAAAAAIRRGELVGIPTDTVYGVGADPFSESAVDRLFAAKDRPPDRAIPVLAASTEDLAVVAVLGEHAAALADVWPGALTVVVRRVNTAPVWVGDARGRVAVRIPDHDMALALLRRTGPLAVTSANVSGEEPAPDETAARAILGDAVAMYLPGVSPGGESSTVVDLTGAEPVVLRPGPVPWPP